MKKKSIRSVKKQKRWRRFNEEDVPLCLRSEQKNSEEGSHESS